MKMEGTNKKLSKIVIDLIEFKIEIHSPNIKEALTLLFDSPSRRFFCSLIALVVIEMKIRNKNFINIRAYTDILSLLDQKLAGKYASDVKEPELMYGKIRKAWPRELSNLENASRFKILYRGKFLKLNSEWGNYDYLNDILDTWPSLIRRHEDQTWFYSFDVNQASITLNDVLIIFGQHKDAEAWERFLESIKPSIQVVEVEEQSEAGLSSIKDNLLAFLSDIKNKLELRLKQKSPIYYQNKIDPKKLFIPIQVTIEKFKKHIVENLFEYSESKEDLRRAYAFKKVEEKTYNEIPWEEVTNSNEPIIVLADPGMGKSTLLIMEALSVVQKEELKLKKNHIIEEDLKFPIYLKLNEISKSDEEISKTILNVVKKNYPETSKPILNILKNSLMAGKCLLLFDGLDEVPRNLYYKLLRRLNRFLLNSNCRIIGTSRIVGYSGGFLGNVKEVEIVPFNEAQIREFVNTYFKNIEKFIEDKSISSKGLLQELSDKPQIRGMAQNPLLITIICRLYQEKDIKLPTRRCLLYKKAINYMLSSWRRKSIKQTEARVQSKISLLEEMAYFFSKKRKEIFSLKELLIFTQKFLNKEKSFTKFYDADSIITELSEDDGIIIKLNREGDRYIFFHLTFQEYLAASYLKEVYEDNQSRAFKIVSKFLYDFRWHETITLLVGLLSDPITFIRYIKEQEDDIFYSLLILAGRCTAECEESSNELVFEIFDKIYKVWTVYSNERYIKLALVALCRSNSSLLKRLLVYFKNEKKFIKKNIAFLIGEIGSSGAIPALVEALGDEDMEVRGNAALALGKIGSSDAIPSLVEALSDESMVVRRYAVIAIGNIGGREAIVPLIKALSNENMQVREFAAEALGKKSRRDAIPALIAVLSDQNIKFRDYAVIAIRKIGGRYAIPALIEALRDKNVNVRFNAAIALGEIGRRDEISALIDALSDKSPSVSFHAAIAIGKIGGRDALPALIRALSDQGIEVREFAAEVLGEIENREAIFMLIEALSDQSIKVREFAAEVLGEIGSHKAIRVLTETFSVESLQLGPYSSIFFEDIDSRKATPALIEALGDESLKVRLNAAIVIGEIGNHDAIPALIEAFGDDSKEVRHNAAIAIGKIGVRIRGAIPSLLAALSDVRLEFRYNSVVALGEIGRQDGIPALKKALSDESIKVKRSAENAIRKIQSRRDPTPFYISLLRDEAMKHRLYGISGIRWYGCRDAIPALIEALSDKSIVVRRNAAFAIGEFGSHEAIPALIKALRHEDQKFKCFAALALCRVGNYEGIQVLIEELKDKDSEIRDFLIMELKKTPNLNILKELVKSHEINIFDPEIFSLARDLAAWFCNENVGFIPVTPEFVGKFKKIDEL